MGGKQGKKRDNNVRLFSTYMGLLIACLFYAVFARPDWEVIPVAVVCTVMAVRHLKRIPIRKGDKND